MLGRFMPMPAESSSSEVAAYPPRQKVSRACRIAASGSYDRGRPRRLVTRQILYYFEQNECGACRGGRGRAGAAAARLPAERIVLATPNPGPGRTPPGDRRRLARLRALRAAGDAGHL